MNQKVKSMKQQTQMVKEAAEAPQRVATMLSENRSQARRIAAKLRGTRPRMIVTCARGSSDHAAAYLRFVFQLILGVPAFDLSPSQASIYDNTLDIEGAMFLLISQSGRSPDMVRAAEWAKENGAQTIGLVNDPTSPLARAVDLVVDIGAGPETSVAATKSYICSAVAGLQIAVEASDNPAFTSALDHLPEALSVAVDLSWNQMLQPFAEAQGAYIAGRGPGLGVVQEMALKFKETCVLHAEAVSAAEILHGPMQLLKSPMPLLVIGQNDESRSSIEGLLSRLSQAEVPYFVAMQDYEGVGQLPVVRNVAPFLAPLVSLQTFYGFVSQLALMRGHDPDHPELLKKVTETV